MKRTLTLKMTQIAMFSCLIAVCAQIAIPIAGVPLTLQTFAVALSGYLLGSFSGGVSVAVYLALGVVGMPVFSGFGGTAAVLFGPTGGFLFGFLFLSIFCGISARGKSRISFIIFSSAGVLVCHLLGFLWFSFVSGVSWIQAFFVASFPYILKDILSVFFAWLISRKIRQRCPHLLLFRFEP